VSDRRVSIYFFGFAFLFLLLILAAFLGRAFVSGTVNKAAWVKQNELVLSTLPLYPGATEARAPYSIGEPDPKVKTKTANGGPFRGYWTTQTYTLPLGARPDLVFSTTLRASATGASSLRRGAVCEVKIAATGRCSKSKPATPHSISASTTERSISAQRPLAEKCW